MKTPFLVPAILVCLTSCTLVSNNRQHITLQDDLERLQGEWRIQSETIDGQKQPDEIRKVTMNYAGHNWTQSKDGVIIREGSSQLRPNANPKEIDITPLRGPAAGEAMPGIYRIKGDTYESCFVLPGNERPTDFSSKKGTGHLHVIFKRADK